VLGLDVADLLDMAVLVPEQPNLDRGVHPQHAGRQREPAAAMQDDAMGTMQMCLTAWNGPAGTSSSTAPKEC
jgi:hypothetical protein